MKTLIFDGSHPNDPSAAKIVAALQAHLPEAETVPLCQQKIGNCAGDFFCWVRSPGMCNTNDDNRALAARIVQSDLLVYLTPVTFGGYASPLKRAVDHQIQIISPFFVSIHGETHHAPRYAHYPDLLVVGWMDAPDPQSEAIFRHLVYRNAINMYAGRSACALLVGELPETELSTQAAHWLETLASSKGLSAPSLPPLPDSPAHRQPPRRAALLVGSPRLTKSTSFSLGDYLMQQLSARGLQTETIQVYTAFSSADKTALALEKLEAADLLVLAFPLYIDSLPAPLIAALEKIAAFRSTAKSDGKRFAAIANCGFPEASHNNTALAICAEFARQSGYGWAGGLALGAGEGLVHGLPLSEMDGRAAPIKKSLDLAAQALARGEPIPQAARDLLARPQIPGWLYRLMGGIGWKQQAKRYGVRQEMKRRPYEAI